MNKLILIGNGFDLAHGLKTKYNDFILWYFNNALKNLAAKGEFSDQLFEISFSHGRLINFPSRATSITQFKEILEHKKDYLKIRFKCGLFKILFNETIELNWVDIESEYYSYLKDLYIKLENRSFKNFKNIEEHVKSLNNDFEFIKVKLQEYLNTVESSEKSQIPDIAEHFKNHFSTVPNPHTQIMFLNFNYTSTIEIYLKYLNHKQYTVNYIHGKLKDASNPIIFGYGDEIDSYYQKIENVNNKEYLKNFKSFGYSINSNYQNFSGFLDRDSFEVYIMGHSCGLSDRTMLNKIVEHKNCRIIKIFYYERSNTENDFIEKTQELSRHFSPDNKGRMRDIIEPLSNSLPLVKCKA